jgi:hypothetical protein
MKYEARCECGKAYPVSTADAGVSFPCACGREVEVPALHAMRAEKGVPGGSPLWGIQAGFMSGALPGPAVCACCRCETTRQVTVAINCERGASGAPALAAQVASGCFMLALMIMSGILIFSRGMLEGSSRGSGLRVTVPVFVCESCNGTVTTVPSIRAALGVTPEYAALLYRYPDATVARNAVVRLSLPTASLLRVTGAFRIRSLMRDGKGLRPARDR